MLLDIVVLHQAAIELLDPLPQQPSSLSVKFLCTLKHGLAVSVHFRGNAAVQNKRVGCECENKHLQQKIKKVQHNQNPQNAIGSVAFRFLFLVSVQNESVGQPKNSSPSCFEQKTQMTIQHAKAGNDADELIEISNRIQLTLRCFLTN